MDAPTCTYCGQALSYANEFDHESGTWFSYHFTCSQPQRGGEFQVASYLDGKTFGTPSEFGFTTLKRAVAEAEYLARSNRGHWLFVVVSEGGDIVHHRVAGQLPERPEYALS